MSFRLSKDAERRIKSTLERLSCPIHKEKPKVAFISGKLSVSCCCDKFTRTITEQCRKETEKAIKEDISKTLRR